MKTSDATPGPARPPHTPEEKRTRPSSDSKKQGDPRRRTPLPEVDYKQLYEALRPQYERAQHEIKLYRLVVSGARLGIPAALEHMGIDPEAVDANPIFQNRNNPKGNQR